MKTTIIICTLFIVFNGTIKFWINEDVKPALKAYALEFAQRP